MENNLNQYYIFNTVAETGNISQAAKLLFISQPAVSKAISSLEESLGIVLFIRGYRGVKLTPEGLLLQEHTKVAFDALRKGEQSLKQIHELGIGHLKIGVSSTLCKYLLLPHLSRFVREYPHIKITIESQSSSHTLKQLENHSLDFGLVAKPERINAFHYHTVSVIEDIFVASKPYLDNLKLRKGEDNIFLDANIMLLDEENITRQYVNHYFKENGITPTQILEVSSMELLIEFAKTGLGVAGVIKEFVEKELADESLVEIPLEKQIYKREVGFSYSKNAFLSDSMQKFLTFLHMN